MRDSEELRFFLRSHPESEKEIDDFIDNFFQFHSGMVIKPPFFVEEISGIWAGKLSSLWFVRNNSCNVFGKFFLNEGIANYVSDKMNKRFMPK